MEPDQFWNWSRALLVAAFGTAIAVILLSAWLSTTLLLFLVALPVGALLLGILVRDELALLCAILIGFVALLRYEEGIQAEEAIYGLLYLGYLTYWFVSRLFFYRDNILRTKADWGLFLFLIYVTLSLGLTVLLDGNIRVAISQWLSLTTLAFYFPIKEVCIRRGARRPKKFILLSLGAVALFVAVRNVLDYKVGLSQADYLWQIASGRVVMNEHVLMMAGLVTLVFLLYARRRPEQGLLTGLFLIFTVGILISQSRAVWVSFAFGVAIIFFAVDRKRRLHIILLGLAGVAAIVVTGLLIFEDSFGLIVAGLADRFFSLQRATSTDISFINRFLEIEAAWESIRQNPILGHGLGVPFKYYSLVFEFTRESSYVHNGYVGVLYRHGLIGFVFLFTFYVGALWVAFKMARRTARRRINRLIAISAVACLAAEGLVGNSANPFATSENPLIIAAIAGLAAAAWHEERRDLPDSERV